MRDAPLLEKAHEYMYEVEKNISYDDVLDALRKLNQDLTIELIGINTSGYVKGINKAIKLIEKHFGVLIEKKESDK